MQTVSSICRYTVLKNLHVALFWLILKKVRLQVSGDINHLNHKDWLTDCGFFYLGYHYKRFIWCWKLLNIWGTKVGFCKYIGG